MLSGWRLFASTCRAGRPASSTDVAAQRAQQAGPARVHVDASAGAYGTANALIWRICGRRFQVATFQVGVNHVKIPIPLRRGHEFSILGSWPHPTLSPVPGDPGDRGGDIVIQKRLRQALDE